jgi:uncharacterized protein
VFLFSYLIRFSVLVGMLAPAAAEAEGGVTSLQEVRQHGLVMQKWDVSCGAAALATLLTYQHNDPVPEKVIVEAMLQRTTPLRVQERGGFSLLELKRFADGRGYVGTGYGSLNLKTLSELAPAIVPIRTGGYNHFVVFRGVRGDRVLLADPAYGNRTMIIARFEGAWLGNLGFTVERPGGPAPPGRLAPHLQELILPPGALVRHSLP